VSNQQAANGVIRALRKTASSRQGRLDRLGDCSGSLDAVKDGETFGTSIQPAYVEGALAVRTAASSSPTARSRATWSSSMSPDAPAIDPGPPPIQLHAACPAIGAEASPTPRSGATQRTRSATASACLVNSGSQH
jgi:hypothetical protein